MTFFSDCVNRIEPSAALVMAQRARDLRAAGHDVISLSIGQPDFDTPDHIKAAAKNAIDRGETRYPPITGTAELKQAITDKFHRDNGLDYPPEQILVANGGKQILFNALMATLNPGDEILIPAPHWVNYVEITHFTGATPVLLKTRPEDGFKLRPEMLADAITSRTKWFLINSPSNPSGAFYTPSELQALTEVLLQHPQVWVLSDDIYEHLRYEGEFTTTAALQPALYDRTLTLNGVSKAYCMTGWRIGYAGGPVELIKAMSKVQSQSTSGACSISQAAAAAALNGDQSSIAEHNAIFRQRRDLVVEGLNACQGLHCHRPQGAFYVYPDCSEWLGKTTPAGRQLENDYDIAEALLDEAQVAVVHGGAFGLSPHFRISYATSTDMLTAACDRIQRFSGALV